MRIMWRQHEVNIRTMGMCRPHGDYMETTWGQHEDNVETTWVQCGDQRDVETMWGQHGDYRDVQTTWVQHGDNMWTT